MNLIIILLLVNSLRAQPLTQTTQLNAIAQNRADYICLTNQYSHKNFEDFFVTYKPGTLVGENLAAGYEDKPINVVTAWILSKTHRENILNSKYKYTGLGYACGFTVELFTS